MNSRPATNLAISNASEMTVQDKYRILVADDQNENVLLISYILKSLPEEYEISHAINGEEAVAIAQKSPHDLILMDWRMPVMGGLEAVRALQSNPKTWEIPIIMITAMTSPESLEEAFNSGVVDFLRKPVERIELAARMRSALRLHESYKEIKLQNELIAQRNQLIEEKKDEIQSYNNELKHLNQLKDKLFSILSHDLKGPLNSLTSFLDTFISHAEVFTQDEVIYYSKEVRQSLKNVSGLLENLLKWSRLQMGKVEFEPEVYSIEAIVRQNIELLGPMAKHKNQALVQRCHGSDEIFADLNMVDFIIRNLVSNAIKFTDTGGEIIISTQEAGDFVRVDIIDNGIGIDPEKLEMLFDASHVFTEAGTKEELGTGLGLMLCKEFVEKNDGRIEVRSEPGKGSTFSIYLPHPEVLEDF